MWNTPIQQIEEQIYIKRDDMIPYSFGGNKARKGFLCFEEIEKGKYDCVVTYGSSHSNHCRIIANMAAARKMPITENCVPKGKIKHSAASATLAIMIKIFCILSFFVGILRTICSLKLSIICPPFIQCR